MKTVILFSLLLLSHALPMQFAKKQALQQSMSRDHVLVFKVERKFKGGEVEVTSSSGDVIVKQILFRSKMKIDFGNVKPGTYTVKLKKGMLVKSFPYQRK